MPELTISVTDDTLAQLEAKGAQLGKTPRKIAESIVHRAFTKTSPGRAASNRERAADRALRHLEIARILSDRKRRKSTLTMEEREELAARFGVTLRTITRDLDVAIMAMMRKEQLAS